MKKSIFLSAIIAVVVLFGNVNAQINLLHKFSEVVDFHYEHDFIGFVSRNKTSGEIRFYNEDFSLRKITNISIPAGYRIITEKLHVSEKIFNTDNKLEFIILYIPISFGGEMNSFYRLYNEDGIILKDLGDSYYIFKNSKGEYRLETSVNGVTEVYSLPGRGNLTSVTPPDRKVTKLSYNLRPGETATMRIFNAKGQLIETRQIDSVFDRVFLNTTNYRRGVYVYEINGVSRKFVVK